MATSRWGLLASLLPLLAGCTIPYGAAVERASGASAPQRYGTLLSEADVIPPKPHAMASTSPIKPATARVTTIPATPAVRTSVIATAALNLSATKPAPLAQVAPSLPPMRPLEPMPSLKTIASTDSHSQAEVRRKLRSPDAKEASRESGDPAAVALLLDPVPQPNFEDNPPVDSAIQLASFREAVPVVAEKPAMTTETSNTAAYRRGVRSYAPTYRP